VSYAVVVLERSCSATPGLAAAWCCRGRPVPPCRHGTPWYSCSRYVRHLPFFYLFYLLLLAVLRLPLLMELL
jgi:hypothetical protein